jgi:hypothetical protein
LFPRRKIFGQVQARRFQGLPEQAVADTSGKHQGGGEEAPTFAVGALPPEL